MSNRSGSANRLLLRGAPAFFFDSCDGFSEVFARSLGTGSRQLERLLASEILGVEPGKAPLCGFGVGSDAVQRFLGIFAWIHNGSCSVCRKSMPAVPGDFYQLVAETDAWRSALTIGCLSAVESCTKKSVDILSMYTIVLLTGTLEHSLGKQVYPFASHFRERHQ